MAPAMLEAISLMEPAMLNYAQFHVQDKDQLEAMRAAASASGPCADVLDLCIKYADEATVKLLAPRLSQLVRTAVGLPSRVGTARFIQQLCTSHAAALTPYAPKLARTLVSVRSTHHHLFTADPPCPAVPQPWQRNGCMRSIYAARLTPDTGARCTRACVGAAG
jgi:hypothetical protein